MEYKEYENTQYSGGNLVTEDVDLERSIQNRNRQISKKYEEIELLKSYNRRDRAAIEEITRQEMEFLKNKLFEYIGIDENEDLRGVFILFNNKLEYVRTIKINEFSEYIKDKEEYSKFNTTFEAFNYYLRSAKLYTHSATDFVDKPLKWYKKTFKDMILSYSGWKVDENGLLTDVAW